MKIIQNKIYSFNILFYLVLAIIVFFTGIYYSKYGLDLTDSGFFLYIQNKIAQGKLTDFGLLNLTSGSDIVGAMWLNIFKNNPDLLFARMGAFFLVYLTSIIIFKIIYEITKDKWVSAISVLLIYIYWPGVKSFPIINYDLAPLLPLSIFYYLCIRIKNNKIISNTNVLNIKLGIISLILVFTRIPLILPILIILFYNIYTDEKTYRFKTLKYYTLGISIGCLIIMLIPISRNYFYLSYINLNKILKGDNTIFYSLNSETNYGLFTQIKFWIRGYSRLLIILIFLLLISFLNKKLQFKINKNLYKLLIATIILTCSLTFGFIGNFFGFDHLQFYNHFLNYFLNAIFILISFILLFEKQNKINEIALISLILFCFYPVGSNSFEKKLILTIPIFFVPTYFIYLKNNNFNSLTYYLDKYFSLRSTIHLLVIIYLTFTTINLFNLIPYRESAINKLTNRIHENGIKNIYTSKERYNAVLPMYKWLQKRNNINKTLLCLDRMSLINYTLKYDGVFDYPWPLLLENNYFFNRLDQLAIENKSPNYIVLPLIDMSNPNWETIKPPFLLDKAHNNYLQKYLLKYKIGFKSDYFCVWEKI